MPLDLTYYRKIVVLTGAGISAGSGLRTYRGPGGVWEEHNVEELGQARALRERPLDVWRLYGSLRAPVRQAEPNAAHLALARWEASLPPDSEFLLVTQNVDSLHRRAGSKNLVELHGNITYTRCSNDDCGLEPFPDEEAHDQAVPKCPRCGGTLRPDIVLFGEMIPPEAGWRAQDALGDCDLFLAIGTSGVVTPAAHFVHSARYAGARTILVNLEASSPPNPAFQEEYLGRGEEVLPRLLGIES
jgi:NAD-dependent deacetylase